MKSIPRHENQHTAAMWWTVEHVAINVELGRGRGRGRGGGVMVVYIVFSSYFCFPCNVHLYLYQLISIIFCILFVRLPFCVSPYIFCNLETNM